MSSSLDISRGRPGLCRTSFRNLPCAGRRRRVCSRRCFWRHACLTRRRCQSMKDVSEQSSPSRAKRSANPSSTSISRSSYAITGANHAVGGRRRRARNRMVLGIEHMAPDGPQIPFFDCWLGRTQPTPFTPHAAVRKDGGCEWRTRRPVGASRGYRKSQSDSVPPAGDARAGCRDHRQARGDRASHTQGVPA